MSARQNAKRVSDLEKEIEELEKLQGKPPVNTDQETGEQEEEENLEETPEVKEVDTEDKDQEEKEPEPTTPEEKTFKKRYGDLRRHFDKTVSDLKAEIEQLSAQKDKASSNIPPLDEKQLEAWMQKNKEAASLIRAIVLKESGKPSQEIKSRIEELEKVKAEIEKSRAEAELLKIHPDFEDIRETDEFHDWAESQPDMVQKALYENDTDGKLAAWAVTLYKNEKGLNKPQKPTSNKKEAARSVKSKSSPEIGDGQKKTFKESDVRKMSMTEYEKNEDAILEAMQEGRFVYDISKKK